MVLQLSEQPTSSLPLIDQPNVSKVPASQDTPVSTGNSTTCLAISSTVLSFDDPQSWAECASRIFERTDELGQYVKRCFAYLAGRLRDLFFTDPNFVYHEAPLSPESRKQLEMVRRKTLVLDLDETLVHSCYLDPDTNDFVGCTLVPASAVPDHVMNIPIIPELDPIEFQIFKRPHVDEFLNFVGSWYDVVIYTASLEAYASIVVDQLDAGRGILRRRFYRQHCVATPTLVSKNLTVIDRDLSSIFIIDNSPSAYRYFPDNAIPIKSYIYDPKDEELLNLLPFLDALRFTKDVRSILGRRSLTHYAQQSEPNP